MSLPPEHEDVRTSAAPGAPAGPSDHGARPPRPGAPRGRAWLAWLLILLAAGSFMFLRTAGDPDASAAVGDEVGNALIEMQAKYFIGARYLPGTGEQLEQVVTALNAGTAGQRLRAAVVAGEVLGPDAAVEVLDELRAETKKAQQRADAEEAKAEAEDEAPRRPPITETQSRVLEILERLYEAPAADGVDASAHADAVRQLPEAQRALLVDQLGWFGKLAIAPEGGPNEALRAEVMQSAWRTFIVIVVAAVLAMLAALAGFIALVVFTVFGLTGQLRSHFRPGLAHHGLYAETFAVWLALFVVLQIVAGRIAEVVPQAGLATMSVVFFVSLLALLWPVVRGVPWTTVQHDVGLTFGRRPALEPAIGVAGYFMALPMLAVGAAIMFVLLLIQEALSSPPDPLAPAGGPAHPIVTEAAGAGWWSVIQLYLAAAVAAPVVEEIMFRGVLYRHLRDATSPLARGGSVVLSGLINTGLFAIIHPQGWVAAPALMGLAAGFVLVREWRGSIVPAIVLHAVSNGLVMTMLILLAG